MPSLAAKKRYLAKLQRLSDLKRQLDETVQQAFVEPTGSFAPMGPEEPVRAPEGAPPVRPGSSRDQAPLAKTEGQIPELAAKGVDLKEWYHQPPAKPEEGIEGFASNFARTLVQFGLFPVDVANQVKDAVVGAATEGVEPGHAAAQDWEDRAVKAVWEVAKVGGKTVAGIGEFIGTNLRDVLIAGNPFRSDDDPKKKEAWERVFATGGLGPIAAAMGIRGPVEFAKGVAEFRARQSLFDEILGKPTGQPQIEYKSGPAPKQLGWDPQDIHGRPIPLGTEPGYYSVVPSTGEPIPLGSSVVYPERPVPTKIRWIRNLTDQFIDSFTDGEARTELRRYFVYIGNDHPRMAEKTIARMPIKRVKDLLRQANQRHRGLPKEPSVEVMHESLPLSPDAPIATPAEVLAIETVPKGTAPERPVVTERPAPTPDLAAKGKPVAGPLEAPEVEAANLLSKAYSKQGLDKTEGARLKELLEAGTIPAVSEAVAKRTVYPAAEVMPAVQGAAERVTKSQVEASAKRLEAITAESEAAAESLIKDANASAGESLRAHEEANALHDIAPESVEKGRVVFAERSNMPLERVELDPGRFQPRDKAYAQETYDAMRTDIESGTWEPAAMDDLIIWKDPKNGKSYALNHSRTTALRDAKTAGWEIADVPVREFTGTEAEAIRFAHEKSNRLATPPTLKDDLRVYQRAKVEGADAKAIKQTFRGKEGLLEDLSGLNANGKFVELLNQEAKEGVPYLQRYARWVGDIRKRIPEITNAHEREIFDFLYQDGAKRNWEIPKDEFYNLIEKRTGDAMWEPSKPLQLKRGALQGTAAREDTGNIVAEIESLKERLKTLKQMESTEAATRERAAILEKIDKLEAGVREIVRSQGDMFSPEQAGFGDEFTAPEGSGVVAQMGGLFRPLARLFGSEAEKMRINLEDLAAKDAARQTPGSVAKSIGEVRSRKQKRLGIFHWAETPSHVMGSIPGPKPRVIRVKFGKEMFTALLDKVTAYGDRAAIIMQKMTWDEIRFLQVLNVANRELFNIMRKISHEDWGKKGEIFFDLFDGKPLSEIIARPDLTIGTKAAAVELRNWLDGKRDMVVQELRGRVRDMVEKKVEREYRRNNGLVRKVLTRDQKVEIVNLREAALRDMYPDDWGLNDYLPHILPGDYTVLKAGKPIGAAKTPHEALLQIAEDAWLDPPTKPNQYAYVFREFMNPDIVRIGNKRRRGIISDVAKNLGGPQYREIVEAATKGKIGSREFRDKYNQFLQKREGVRGGMVKELPFVLNYYNWSMTRWLHFSKMRRTIQPAIDALRTTNPKAAEYLDGTFETLWGKRSKAAMTLDDALRATPYFGDHMSPYPVETALSWVKQATYYGLLKANPSFMLGMNNLQVFQTLWPIMTKADQGIFLSSLKPKLGRWAIPDADWQLLEHYKVNDLLSRGGKLAETTRFSLKRGKPVGSRDAQAKAGVFASETSNQQVAWLAMYKIARRQGLSADLAAQYAFLRGNIYTQFLFLRTDIPMYMRGPFTSTVFMYKRFPTSAIQMGLNELRNGRIAPSVRWLGSQFLLGGTSSLMKLLPVQAALRLARKVDDDIPPEGYLTAEAFTKARNMFGTDAALVIHAGLPAIFGVDMSNRFNLIDVPYGDNVQEKLGAMSLTIPGSIVADIIGAAMDTKGPEPTSALGRAAREAGRKIPALRPLEWIGRLQDLEDAFVRGEFDMKDASGRRRYADNLKGVFKEALSFRSIGVDEENARGLGAGGEDLFIQYQLAMQTWRDEKLDDYVMDIMQEGHPDFEDMQKWSGLFPEYAIRPRDAWVRYRSRTKTKDQTTSERMMSRGPAVAKRQDKRIRQRLFGPEPGTELK